MSLSRYTVTVKADDDTDENAVIGYDPPLRTFFLQAFPDEQTDQYALWFGTLLSGSVFRKIDRWGNVSQRALEPAAVNATVKKRAEMAGLEPTDLSAHGLRSGYFTEAANRGISLPEAMEQSRHRSFQPASSYHNNATTRSGRAARLL
ncbi:integrase [Pseudorhizobium halotolerans]|uniref:Integrase n=1 Tax=Pseudorhizobium halotolerans TaxID=1233081 RepID=A0ABM8PXE1_9HYPH|nr:integrase [Rhizobium sp. Khangiran2]CAD7053692.1 integrase [Pseudorhizobium halotolerans]